MSGFRAVLDSCVLVPIVKADLLLTFACDHAYSPLWTERILGEVEAAIVKVTAGAVTADQARKRTRSMERFFDDALIADWEPLELSIEGLPDRNDRHVVAAAIRGSASIIVTDNIQDFPSSELDRWGLHAKTSDDFLLDLLDLHRGRGIRGLIQMSERRRNPPTTVAELLDILERSGAPRFAREARMILDT